jgi:hypothetical protein
MITSNEMSYEDMKAAIARGSLCMECNNVLKTVWGGAYGHNGYLLVCGRDMNHNGITRHNKKLEKKIQEGYSMETTALEKLSEDKMLERVNMARFPQEMNLQEKKLLAQVAITYGFDPLMGEVTLYQGRPFVSIDGRYRKAQETGMLDGISTVPASKDEREAWQIPEGDYFFRAELWLKGSTRPIVGWGRVRKQETTGGKGYKPIETNPQRMAEKRAEAQALRKGFHINLPSVEEIGSQDEEFAGQVPTVNISEIVVDTDTGEIFDEQEKTEPVQSKSNPAKKSTKAVTPPEPEQEPEQSEEKPQAVMPRDPATVKSIPELMTACFKDFGMQPPAVLKVLGASSSSAIVDTPSECYIQVANAQPES